MCILTNYNRLDRTFANAVSNIMSWKNCKLNIMRTYKIFFTIDILLISTYFLSLFLTLYRERSVSAEKSHRSQGRDRRKSRSQSPNWRSSSPTIRKVRYRSRTRSRSPVQTVRAKSPDRRGTSEKGRSVQDVQPESR